MQDLTLYPLLNTTCEQIKDDRIGSLVVLMLRMLPPKTLAQIEAELTDGPTDGQ